MTFRRSLSLGCLGLLCVGLPAVLCRSARGAAQEPAALPQTQVQTQTLSVPIVPSGLSGMGQELRRALLAALRESGIAARSASSDSEATLAAHLEELSAQRFRLTLSHRGKSAQAVGDLEHLDDLVYAVVSELCPRLAVGATSGGPGPIATKRPAETVGKPGSPPTTPTKAAASTAKTTETPTKAAASPVKTTETPTKPPDLPTRPFAVAPTPEPERKLRPRVAVGIMGEPLGPLPPGFYGLGLSGQQAVLTFLQQRLQVPTVAIRVYGLVGGMEALDQSVRVGARHTVMTRLDAFAAVAGRLQGRIHLVLLRDGKLMYDRSVSLPPLAAHPSETPSQWFARAVLAALETIAPDLQF